MIGDLYVLCSFFSTNNSKENEKGIKIVTRKDYFIKWTRKRIQTSYTNNTKLKNIVHSNASLL